jgi:hypothetical protein
MRYLVTRVNEDGSFDEVGMRNRTFVSGYKLYRNAFRYAINPFGNGKLVRIECFPDSGSINTPIDIFTAVTYKE